MRIILKIFTTAVVILLFSCSSIQKKEYKIFKSYLTDKNRVKKFEDKCNSQKIKISDTIIICSTYLSNTTFERYVFFDKNNSNDVTLWIDCKENYLLNKKELYYIKSEILKLDYEKVNLKNLNFKNFKTINLNKSNSTQIENNIIYYFSKPIISSNNNFCFFYCSYYFKDIRIKGSYEIMKKINNKWLYIGELCENNIID